MPDKITKAVIVQGKVGDIYNMWANFESFPQFMKHIKAVTRTGEDTSHWVMEGPLGSDIEWDARTTTLDKNKRLAWSSFDGDIKTSGQVTFNELSPGETEITATVQYIPPAGKAGQVVAKIFEKPEEVLAEDLRNFKEYAEGAHTAATT